MNQQRLRRIVEKMKRNQIQQMIISDPLTIHYLTGVMLHPGERLAVLLVRTDGDPILIANQIFVLPEMGIPVLRYSDQEDGAALIADCVRHDVVLGIDKNWPSRFLLRLMELGAADSYCNASFCCDEVRWSKDAEEQKRMKEASALNDQCMEEFRQLIRPGITEREMAEQIEAIYRKHGASDVSFQPIVGFGANAADPHHDNDDTPLQKGMAVLIDCGCIWQGYCSDMTRTFFTAEPSQEELDIYELVRNANLAAEEKIRPGVPLCEIDAAARKFIAAGGYGKYFTHRLGHFIGQEVHEFGDVSPTTPIVAEPGMIFSIEPGVYLPGKFGVRIEDLVLVTETGCEILNSYPKTPIVVPMP